MQDDAGGIDEGPQGLTQVLLKLTSDGIAQAGKGKVECPFIELAGSDLLAPAAEYGASGLRDGGMAMELQQRQEFR